MRPRASARFRVELGLAISLVVFAVVTLLSRDWIEVVFGVDPDHHAGWLEWLIVMGFAVGGLITSMLARRDWLRIHGARRAPATE
jgi:hypothetical protein